MYTFLGYLTYTFLTINFVARITHADKVIKVLVLVAANVTGIAESRRLITPSLFPVIKQSLIQSIVIGF